MTSPASRPRTGMVLRFATVSTAAMALAAHVLALLDDTAAKGNRPDQLRVLEEWLVPR